MKRKIIGLLLCFVCAFAFCGCAPETTPPQTPTEPTQPTTPTEPTTPTDTGMTLDTLLRDHAAKAKTFFETYLRPSAVEQREVKSETAYLVENNAKQIVKAQFVYIYVDETTTRKIELATATLSAPVAIKDIAAEKTVSVTPSWERKTVFTFDAKTNYDLKNVTNALYEILEEDSSVKLIQETESTDSTTRAFTYIVEKGNKLTTKSFETLKGDGSETTLLKNINRGYIIDLTKNADYTLEGKKVYATAYTLEQIETPPVTPPDEPDPEPVTNAELIAALEAKCANGIYKKCLIGLEYNIEKISNGTWYVTRSIDDKITEAEYTFNYKDTEVVAYYIVGKVSFASPISAQELKDGNISNATYTQAYDRHYDPSISYPESQDYRGDLINAICDKVFGEKSGATRYIVEGTPTTDTGLGMRAGVFKVIEVFDNGIQEKTVYIKESTTDQGYINNLKSEQNYRYEAGESYTIHGEKLTSED